MPGPTASMKSAVPCSMALSISILVEIVHLTWKPMTAPLVSPSRRSGIKGHTARSSEQIWCYDTSPTIKSRMGPSL